MENEHFFIRDFVGTSGLFIFLGDHELRCRSCWRRSTAITDNYSFTLKNPCLKNWTKHHRLTVRETLLFATFHRSPKNIYIKMTNCKVLDNFSRTNGFIFFRNLSLIKKIAFEHYLRKMRISLFLISHVRVYVFIFIGDRGLECRSCWRRLSPIAELRVPPEKINAKMCPREKYRLNKFYVRT